MGKVKQQEIRDSNDRYIDRKLAERDSTMQIADNVKGVIQVERYSGANFSIDEQYELDLCMFDTLLIKLVDGDSELKMEGGLYIPTGATNRVWRTGEVIISGESARVIKEGDLVIFPSDKGMETRSVNVKGKGVLKNCIFIAEDRIFARAVRSKR